ncbi:MAG: hypothetical protein DI586_03385 [Micavibrio aeruginosavorus]|uniref:Peptidase S54 rhomboid domain-containing protein n=1 Tax=Micavibrio aeruginosavorus TaxID=349221 RepID=A0A2W5FQ69_9BACT|nr:MAG: hypothetical protein DI586_03385 [Micavibrio aeruginosavorus]
MQNNIPQNDNVIRFKKKKDPQKPSPQHPPLISLPPATKYLAGAIIACHLILWLASKYIPQLNIDMIYNDFGFVSARWTGDEILPARSLLSLITVNFLHGGWFHLIINTVTLIAFGAGIEKLLGAKDMLVIFFCSSALALLTHLAVSPSSIEPVIGASGGISGLFGAILIVLKHVGRLNGSNQNLLPMIALWIALTIGFGMMGAPDGSSIAWVAHIGGFLGGLGIAALMLKQKNI